MPSFIALEPSPNQLPAIYRGAATARADALATPAWTTPRIFEIPVGTEINAYACAERN